MEFALTLRQLLARPKTLAVGVLVATLVAVLSVYRVQMLLPPKLHIRGLQNASASTELLIDTPQSSLGNVKQELDPLVNRATIDANVMTSPAVLAVIGPQAGIPADQIYAAGPIDPNVPQVVEEPTAVKRNVQIAGETAPYRLQFSADPNLPIIAVAAQAPTPAQAARLANAAASGFAQYVANLEAQQQVPAAVRVSVVQLGTAHGAADNAGVGKKLAALVFIAVFVAWCLLMLVMTRFRQTWRESRLALTDYEPLLAADEGVPANGHSEREFAMAMAKSPNAGADAPPDSPSTPAKRRSGRRSLRRPAASKKS